MALQDLEVIKEDQGQHIICRRMAVSGSVNGRFVRGLGCYDREIFDKLLRPGETGWKWSVAWMADGSTFLNYWMTKKGMIVRKREPFDKMPVCFTPMIPGQEWTKADGVGFSYREELCNTELTFAHGGKGFGYNEVVGYDGYPDI